MQLSPARVVIASLLMLVGMFPFVFGAFFLLMIPLGWPAPPILASLALGLALLIAGVAVQGVPIERSVTVTVDTPAEVVLDRLVALATVLRDQVRLIPSEVKAVGRVGRLVNTAFGIPEGLDLLIDRRSESVVVATQVGRIVGQAVATVSPDGGRTRIAMDIRVTPRGLVGRVLLTLAVRWLPRLSLDESQSVAEAERTAFAALTDVLKEALSVPDDQFDAAVLTAITDPYRRAAAPEGPPPVVASLDDETATPPARTGSGP